MTTQRSLSSGRISIVRPRPSALIWRAPALLAVLLVLSACGTEPNYESGLTGRWEGTFRGQIGISAVEVDIERVSDGTLSGTGRLGFTGVGVRLPVKGTYDPPLMQIIIEGDDDAFFTMVMRLDGSTMTGRALSTFGVPGSPGGPGDVILSRRVSSVAEGSQ